MIALIKIALADSTRPGSLVHAYLACLQSLLSLQVDALLALGVCNELKVEFLHKID